MASYRGHRFVLGVVLAAAVAGGCEEGPKYHPDAGAGARGNGSGGATASAGQGESAVRPGTGGLPGTSSGGTVDSGSGGQGSGGQGAGGQGSGGQGSGGQAIDAGVLDAAVVAPSDTAGNVTDGSACMLGAKQCHDLQPQECDSVGVWQNAGPACPVACSAGLCTA